jgi:hypothetical protein
VGGSNCFRDYARLVTFIEITWKTHIMLWFVEIAPSLYGFSDHPQGSHSGSKFSLLVGRIKENTMSYCGPWGAFFLQTGPTESNISKGMNFGTHRRISMPLLSLYPSFSIYSIYIVITFMDEVIYLAIIVTCLD